MRGRVRRNPQALTEDERVALGNVLWLAKDAVLPSGTNLLAPVLLEMPAPKGVDPEAIVRAHLFEPDVRELLTAPHPFSSRESTDKTNRLLELVAASGKLAPTREQATRLFAEMTDWAQNEQKSAPKPDSLTAPFAADIRARARQYVGTILARLVVPSLHPEDLTEQKAEALFEFIGHPSGGTAIEALPYFADASPQLLPEIMRRIRRGLISRDFDQVTGSAMAVEKWTTLNLPRVKVRLPSQILEQLLSGIEIRHAVGLQCLIYCARKLVELTVIGAEDGLRLDEALGDLFVEKAYDRIELDSREAASVSLVRAECVRLSHALKTARVGGPNAENWLKAARQDPLPEVRFAVLESTYLNG